MSKIDEMSREDILRMLVENKRHKAMESAFMCIFLVLVALLFVGADYVGHM